MGCQRRSAMRGPVVNAKKATPTPTGPGVSPHDGRSNLGATEEPVQRPSWQGPGTVVEDDE